MNTVPLRRLVTCVVEPATVQLATLQLENVVGGAATLLGDLDASALFGQYRFRPGDVLFSKLRPYLAKSYLVERDLNGSGEFLCMRPHAGLDSGYLTYATLSRPWLEHAAMNSYGTKMPRTSWDHMSGYQLAVPTLAEQRRITNFLDDRVARVDRIIAARRQQIKLVEASARSQVATEMENGRADWLHGQLRRFVTSHDYQRIPLSSEERSNRQGPYPYYGASGVIDWIDEYLFDGPRVLLSEDGANLLMRNSPIAFVADGQYWVNNHVHILEPADGAHNFWAARIEVLEVSPWVSGSAQPKLTIEAALSLPVSAPAEIADRHAIGAAVATLKHSTEMRRQTLMGSIDLLAEYKTSLITAAVTGELDVTTAGSGVPNG